MICLEGFGEATTSWLPGLGADTRLRPSDLSRSSCSVNGVETVIGLNSVPNSVCPIDDTLDPIDRAGDKLDLTLGKFAGSALKT